MTTKIQNIGEFKFTVYLAEYMEQTNLTDSEIGENSGFEIGCWIR